MTIRQHKTTPVISALLSIGSLDVAKELVLSVGRLVGDASRYTNVLNLKVKNN